MLNTYSHISLSIFEFGQQFDIQAHAEQQCGLFKASAIQKCFEAMLFGLSPATSVIAYKDDESGKLVSVRQSDLINHLLALVFPEEMLIKPARAMYNFIPRLEGVAPLTIIKSPESISLFKHHCAQIGATDREYHEVSTALDAFSKYKINIYVYSSADLAFKAANLS